MEPEPPAGRSERDAVIEEATFLLAEKRTYLATLRTGLAILTVPLSLVSLLVATSRLYDASRVAPFLVPIAVASAGLAALSVYLMVRSLAKIHRIDRLVVHLRRRFPILRELTP